MAKTTIVQLVDDLDGSEAHETIKFGLDGLSYEIDLSNKNAAKLRTALQTYVDHGTRISGRVMAASRGGARRPAVAEREQNKAIRAWAVRKGLDVAPRGRIRSDIVEQYHREAGR
jgi:nucleoid-associated protein Lsr2